jgi:hypothetical protein
MPSNWTTNFGCSFANLWAAEFNASLALKWGQNEIILKMNYRSKLVAFNEHKMRETWREFIG